MRFKTIAVISSTKDTAGMTSQKAVLAHKGVHKTKKTWDKHPVYSLPSPDGLECSYYTTDRDTIFLENIDKEIEADLFLFLTKHASAKEVHSLTCHPIGNFGLAEYGGEERTLVPAPATLMKKCIQKLQEVNDREKLGFEVTTECTHHGPYLETPTMFLEIGSTEEQYKRKDAGEAIAETFYYLLHEVIPNYLTFQHSHAIAIGGTHYVANFQKVLQHTDVAIGHVIPKHMLEYLDESMLEEMRLKHSDGELDYVLVDWKGVGKYKEELKALLEPFCEQHACEWMHVQKFPAD